jgi:hypothetical protein
LLYLFIAILLVKIARVTRAFNLGLRNQTCFQSMVRQKSQVIFSPSKISSDFYKMSLSELVKSFGCAAFWVTFEHLLKIQCPPLNIT